MPNWSSRTLAQPVLRSPARSERRDAPVIEYLEADPEVLRMRDDIARFIATCSCCLERDNRSYLTVGDRLYWRTASFRCIAEWLGCHFGGQARVIVRHREIRRRNRTANPGCNGFRCCGSRDWLVPFSAQCCARPSLAWQGGSADKAVVARGGEVFAELDLVQESPHRGTWPVWHDHHRRRFGGACAWSPTPAPHQ